MRLFRAVNWIRNSLGLVREDEQLLNFLRKSFPSARFADDLTLQGLEHGSLSFGSGVCIGKGSMIALGSRQLGFGDLSIGDNTWIGQYNNFRLAAAANISVGRCCLISQFCSLVAANHNVSDGAPISSSGINKDKVGVKIGDGVWLGAGCVILPGVDIGDDAVVGANSVVNKSIPAGEIWAGPAASKIGVRH